MSAIAYAGAPIREGGCMCFCVVSRLPYALAVAALIASLGCSGKGSRSSGSDSGNDAGSDSDTVGSDPAGNGDGGTKDDTGDVDVNTPPPDDTAPPDIVSASAIANTTIRVVFSEPVVPSSVAVTSFHVQGSGHALAVVQASLDSDGRAVTLTVDAGMQQGATYTLLVQTVSDLQGNAIANATKDFLGRGAVVAELSAVPASLTNVVSASVVVGGTDIVAYQYALSGASQAGSWSAELATDSVVALSDLTDGVYTLKVVGKDSLGNWQGYDEPTSALWTLDTTAPVAELTAAPPAITSGTSAAFRVGGSGVVAYKSVLDGGDVSSESDVGSTLAVDGLSDGPHTLVVIGRDAAGNWQTLADAKPFTWTIDPNASTALLSGLPADPTRVTGLDVAVSGNGVTRYIYSLDAGAWSATTDVGTLITAADLADGAHTLAVVGSDAAGNAQDTPTTHAWTVDTVAPVATISNGPSALTNVTSTHIVVGDVASFTYTLDGASPSGIYTVSQTIDLTGLGEGAHTLAVAGADAAGNWQTAATTITWTIDTTPPVAVVSAIAALTNSSSLSATVTGASVTDFKYQLDNTAWSGEIDVTSAIAVSAVVEGAHTLRVIGRDAAGNWQSIASATTASWTVDTTPPVATLNGLPPTLTASTELDVSVDGCVVYRVSVDDGGWSAVTDAAQNIARQGLTEGAHSIAVVGADAAGNLQTSATTYAWTIDTTAPSGVVLTNVPANPSNDAAPQVGISGTDIVAYSYAVDGGTWSSFVDVARPITLAVGEGSHTLSVRGKDGAGNVQSAATVISWSVDLTAPKVTLSGAPAPLTNLNVASITVLGADFYSARLDGGAWTVATAIANPIVLTGLTDGAHTLDVLGLDAAGNWQTTVTSATWTVDRTAPAAPTVNDRSGSVGGLGSYSTDLSLTFAWSNPGDAVEVAIQVARDAAFTSIVFGGASGASVGTAQSYDYVVDADDGAVYYARVRVRDAAQNWSPFGAASDGIAVTGGVSGVIKNSNLGLVSGATIALQLTDGTAIATTTSSGTGGFTFDNVAIGVTRYKLVVSATGYNGASKSNVSVLVGATSDIGIIYLVSTTASPGTLTGTVVDANAGAKVTGATVKVIDWTGVTATTATTSTTTGGFTTTSVSPGTYTLVFSKTGFFDLQVDNIIVDGNKDVGRQALCQVLAEPQIRVVLLWGSAPADLDLHVVGPSAKTVTADSTPNNRFHVFWNGQKSYDENSAKYLRTADATGTSSTTSLVQDDTSAYGPEAINLFGHGSGYANGIYTFTVHDYSNTNWYAAPVTARIYDAQGLVQEIPIPTGGDANYFWRVFKIDIQGPSRGQRTITVSNSFTSAPANSWNTKSVMDW